jgi:hypothetical protein
MISGFDWCCCCQPCVRVSEKKMMIVKSISNPRVLNFRMQRELNMDKKKHKFRWYGCIAELGFAFDIHVFFFYFSFVPF